MGETWAARRRKQDEQANESFAMALATSDLPESTYSRIIGAEMLGIITTDLAGNVVHWNAVAETMFGWSWKDAEGRHLEELLSPEPIDDERSGPADDEVHDKPKSKRHNGETKRSRPKSSSRRQVDKEARSAKGRVFAGIEKDGSWSGALVSSRASGPSEPRHVSASLLTSPKGTVTGYVAVCTPVQDAADTDPHQKADAGEVAEAGSDEAAAMRDRFRMVFADSPVGTALVGIDARIMDVNHSLCRSLGFSADELVGKNFVEFTHPEDRDLEFDYAQRLFDGKIDRFQIDRRFPRSDGSEMIGRITASAARDAGGRVLFGIGVVEDVTERLRAEHAHLESETVFRRTIEASSDAFVGLDSSGRVTDWNPAAERLFGWTSNEAIGRSLISMVIPEEYLNSYTASLMEAIASGVRNRASEAPVSALLKDRSGREFPVEISLVVVEQDGQLCAKAFVRDVSERHALEQQLTRQALTDSLTDLPNRALLRDRLDTAIARLERNPGLAAVMMLDMDRFKVVNDSLGHVAGDEMLKIVADRIRSIVRVGDTVGRVGGDEFVVVAEDFEDTSEVVFLADRIIEAVSAPLELQGVEVHPGASIGIAVTTDSYATADKLLRDADLSMYRAKERGGGFAELFDEDLYARALARLELEAELRRAIDEQQLRVFYQPVVSFDGRVCGFEALVRWEHPDRGLVSPVDFIPLAEETGLVIPLGAWVLDAAAKQVALWQENIDPELHLSVNLSSRQLADPDLPKVVARILEESGLPANKLCLELTETALIEDPLVAERCLTDLRALGVKIGVDDFGTGYSSLIYVRRFPVQVLKLDRLFVAGLGESPEDEKIAGSVIHLAHDLGLEAVAEGVETLDQLNALDSLGCDLAQGFYWSKPRPADEIELVLREGHKLGPRNTSEVHDPRSSADKREMLPGPMTPDSAGIEEVVPAVRAAS